MQLSTIQKCSALPWQYSNAFRLLWCRATKTFVLLFTIKTYLGLRVKCPIFLSEFNQMWSVSTDIREVLNIKTHENLFSGTRADLCGRQGEGHMKILKHENWSENKLTVVPVNQMQNFNRGNWPYTMTVSVGRYFFKIVPLTVEALFKSVVRLSIPKGQVGMSLLRHPRDGSTLAAFIAGDAMSWQVVLKGRKRMKIAVWQIPTVWGMVLCFPTEILQNVTSLSCCVWSGTLKEQNHHMNTKTVTSSPDGFSPASQPSTVSVAVKCPRTRKSSSSTTIESQKTAASTLPATLNFFLGERGGSTTWLIADWWKWSYGSMSHHP